MYIVCNDQLNIINISSSSNIVIYASNSLLPKIRRLGPKDGKHVRICTAVHYEAGVLNQSRWPDLRASVLRILGDRPDNPPLLVNVFHRPASVGLRLKNS